MFGSIVASMLLEWTRTSGHRPELVEVLRRLGPSTSLIRIANRGTGVWRLLVVPLLVLAYLLRRARGGHRP